VPVWWFAVRKYHDSSGALGFVRFGFSAVGIGLGLLLVFYFANSFYAMLLEQFGLRVQSDMTPVLRGLSTPWPLFVTIVLIAPVVEETFFRGFVFAGLRSRYDWRKAAVISAALFSAAHMELTFFIPGFVLGLLFAYLYQRSNSIWPGMIVHALMNALAVTLAYWVV
jgi:membrane protease YdiL (CAAX protease family)